MKIAIRVASAGYAMTVGAPVWWLWAEGLPYSAVFIAGIATMIVGAVLIVNEATK